jgi:hypothetical protein
MYAIQQSTNTVPERGGGFDRTKDVIIKEKFILATEHGNVETRSAPPPNLGKSMLGQATGQI